MICTNTAFATVVPNNSQDRIAGLKKLQEMTGRHEYFMAAAELAELQRRYPSDLDITLAAAKLHQEMGFSAQAEDEYLKVLQARPNLPEACVALSTIYLQKLEVRKALDYARQAFTSSPSTKTRLTLVSALLAAGKVDEANSELQKLLRNDGQNAQVQYMAYELSLSLNRNKDALRYLEAAINIAPSSAEWLVELSDLYKESGEYHYARNALERVLSIDPASIDALNKLAVIYEFYLHDYDKAIMQYRKILAHDPDSVTALAGLDRCRIKKNDIAGAIKVQLRAMLSNLSNMGKGQSE